ncbi:jg10236 [Pararge aegeria aegeria]|uniref:Jg10236 protein n=1 Tax=Pararge aegeria aegeria TaxID=348720 RepID=A0A8S4SA26_9NEOP|nr:jg10236 [Pararge aegeria aegeria]
MGHRGRVLPREKSADMKIRRGAVLGRRAGGGTWCGEERGARRLYLGHPGRPTINKREAARAVYPLTSTALPYT